MWFSDGPGRWWPVRSDGQGQAAGGCTFPPGEQTATVGPLDVSIAGMSDDQQLVEAVLARVPGAFERLVARHQNLVWHLVYRMVRQVKAVLR